MTYTPDFGDSVTFYAIPQYGYYLKNWDNGNSDLVQNITITKDTLLSAIFEEYLPVTIHDTVIIEVPVNVYIHDTITKEENVYIHDTIITEVPVTAFIHDTTIVEIPVYLHDTIIIENPENIVHDTITIEESKIVYVHDTTIVEIPVDVYVRDTINTFVHDTIYINKTDTIYLQTAVYEKSAITLGIHPNPTASYVIIEGDREFSYVLTNINGKVIKKEENSASYLIELSNCPNGIYMLTTSDGVTHKIVKQ